MSDDMAYENPIKRYWRVGPYRVGHARQLGWEVERHGLCMIRSTPWAAWFDWRRLYREWRANPGAFIGEEP